MLNFGAEEALLPGGPFPASKNVGSTPRFVRLLMWGGACVTAVLFAVGNFMLIKNMMGENEIGNFSIPNMPVKNTVNDIRNSGLPNVTEFLQLKTESESGSPSDSDHGRWFVVTERNARTSTKNDLLLLTVLCYKS